MLKVLLSVKLAPVTSNDSQTEKRTLQQWPGQQLSPLTTLIFSQPLLRVVWRAYFTEGDILSRTTPMMRQEMIRPASFSSLSRVRLKSWWPCSLRFVCHFWLFGGNCIKVLWLFSLNIVLKCQTMTPPLNGFIDGNCANSYGSTCSIHCNNGYNLLGAENLTCEARSGQITGYWDNAVPVCRGNETRSLSSREKAIAGAKKIVCLV